MQAPHSFFKGWVGLLSLAIISLALNTTQDRDCPMSEGTALAQRIIEPLSLPDPKMRLRFQRDPYWISYYYSMDKTNPLQWRCKRLVDIVLSLIVLTVGSPLFILIALFIVLESPGPVLFKQERVGAHGRRFHMLKFRSMYMDAEDRLVELMAHNETNSGMFKMFNDPRVTRVGRFIRKYSLDELPQVLNVLMGQMSLVGPRPPIPMELKKYKDWHFVRFSSKPGMTGMWQVNGRSSITNFDKVVELDYTYIVNWSLWQDFLLMFKTVPVVLNGTNSA